MKQIMSVLLAICVLSATALASDVNPWIGTYSDGETAHYDIPASQSKAIDILAGLGILSDAAYYKEICLNPINRADAAEILYEFSPYRGDENAFAGTELAFDDLGKSYLNSAVKYVVSEKIMEGTSDKLFSPKDNLSYDMLMKAICVFMGLREYAEYHGGYPSGYRKAAAENSLVEIKPENYEEITTGEFALCIYELLDKHRYIRKAIYGNTGEPRSEYTAEDNNMLYVSLGLYSDEGIVEATPGAAINSSYDRINGIAVNGRIYSAANYSAQKRLELEKLVARKVELYYSDDSGYAELVYCYTDSAMSRVTKIMARDIEGITDNRIETEEKDYSVDKLAGVIKNGKYSGKKFHMLGGNSAIPKNGYINLIDNGDDGTADYIEIYDFVYIIVDTADSRKRVISDKFGKPNITLEDTSVSIHPVLVKNGKIASFSDLSEWTAVGILYAEDGEMTSVEISPYPSISGTVETVDSEGLCKIGENIYQIADTDGLSGNAAISSANIKAGITATFIFNNVNEIIAVRSPEISEKGDMLAYLVGAKYKINLDVLTVKLFTEEGDMLELEAADKLTVNNQSAASKAFVYGLIAPDDSVKQGVVVIRCDNENKLKKINLPVDVSASEPEYDGCVTFDSYFARRTFISAHSKFEYTDKGADPSAREFYMTSDTVVFGVPSSYTGKSDDSKFSVGDMSIFKNEVSYNVAAYNLDDEYNAGAVTAYIANSAVIDNNYTPIGIVTGKGEGIDKDGNRITTLSVWFNGSENSYNIASGAELKMYQPYSSSDYITIEPDSIKRGDAVRVAFDSSGDIGALAKNLPNTPNGTLSPSLGSFVVGRGAYNECTYGKVVKKSGVTVVVEANESGKPIEFVFRIKSGANIYVYDVRADKIYKGSVADIVAEKSGGSPSYILVKALNNTVEDVVVYNY